MAGRAGGLLPRLTRRETFRATHRGPVAAWDGMPVCTGYSGSRKRCLQLFAIHGPRRDCTFGRTTFLLETLRESFLRFTRKTDHSHGHTSSQRESFEELDSRTTCFMWACRAE